MTALVLDRVRAFRLKVPAARLRLWIAAAISLIVVVALVGIAGLPTGTRSPEGLVPGSARLAAQARVDDVEVLLTVEAGKLIAIVAYEGEKGWLGVDLDPVKSGTVAAWAATRGEGEVPALSTVYGRAPLSRSEGAARAPGAHLLVRWSDGEVSHVEPERDGSYVVARPGRVEVDTVVVTERGETVIEVTEL
ncbi:MAG: hypothetical protein HYU28_09360 [Actinobacteria bacterium]|nr:hypothetical protein [Actinomycetota bacterium]